MLKLTSFDWDAGHKQEYFGDAAKLEADLLKLYPDVVSRGMDLDEMVRAVNAHQLYSVRVDKVEQNHQLPADYLSHYDNPPEDPWVRAADLDKDD